MKVFWSWQSDTPGSTGRHFVRAALDEAIDELKTAREVEEPPEAARREQLHADSGREGVRGSPDLAATIMAKIDEASVVISDVTPVGAGSPRRTSDGTDIPPKALMNPNVAIELGYALGRHTTASTNNLLMVLNTFYGNRSSLPFDLAHKAGPIEYHLAPKATKEERKAEQSRLRGEFIVALRPFLERGLAATTRSEIQEVPTTTNIASFWQPSDILVRVVTNPIARLVGKDEEVIEYRFDAPRIFYLRLVPTVPRSAPIRRSELYDLVQRHRPQVLTRTVNGGLPERNQFGAIAYEPHGDSPDLVGFTQIFRNGEIWGVTREFVVPYNGELAIPTVNMENIYQRVLAGYVSLAHDDLALTPPYEIELGAVGLQDVRLGLPRPVLHGNLSARINEHELRMRRVLNDLAGSAQHSLIRQFVDELLDLVGIALPQD